MHLILVISCVRERESEMPTPTTVVEIKNVSKRFVLRKEKSLKERLVNLGRSNLHKEDFFALNNVSLEIQQGTTVGLIGANGSGKSTLLKTIGGILQPTSGTVRRKGRLAALLELGAGFHPDLTGRENVYLNAAILGLSKSQTDEYFDEIVEFSGIPEFIDTQVKFYSSGMYVRLAFAVAVHVNPDILIVDEVLAVGDEPFQRKCLDRIRKFKDEGKTIILVSHALEQVGELCDRVVVLEHGNLIYEGEPAEGLRILRGEFEEDRISKEQTKKLSGIETENINIEKIQIRSNGSIIPTESALLSTTDDLEIHITINSKIPGLRPIIGMGIDTPLGQIVFGTNTVLLGMNNLVLESKLTAIFTLPNLPLGHGQYFVHASVGTVETGEMSRVPQAASFVIHGDGTSQGTSFIASRLSIK